MSTCEMLLVGAASTWGKNVEKQLNVALRYGCATKQSNVKTVSEIRREFYKGRSYLFRIDLVLQSQNHHGNLQPFTYITYVNSKW